MRQNRFDCAITPFDLTSNNICRSTFGGKRCWISTAHFCVSLVTQSINFIYTLIMDTWRMNLTNDLASNKTYTHNLRPVKHYFIQTTHSCEKEILFALHFAISQMWKWINRMITTLTTDYVSLVMKVSKFTLTVIYI